MKARFKLVLAAGGVGLAVYVAMMAMTAPAGNSLLTIAGLALIGVGLCKQAREAERRIQPAPAPAKDR